MDHDNDTNDNRFPKLFSLDQCHEHLYSMILETCENLPGNAMAYYAPYPLFI